LPAGAGGDYSSNNETMRNRLKKFVLALLTPFKPWLEAITRGEARLAARWAAAAHHRLLRVQWGLAPQPEHFDHRIDLYYQWPVLRSSFWLERGVFGGLALRPGGSLLELACGDGFNARYFYSLRCSRVVACDFDPQAIATARRANAAPNVTHVLADIRTDMPAGRFDNVVWDTAIEHFTPEEIDQVLRAVRTRLVPLGVLVGSTLVAREDGQKALSHHEYEFKGKEDLRRVLAPHFANVMVFETPHPDRRNLYFWASDGVLPFSPQWPDACAQYSAGQ
jgi:SAM-dependent methyltransferase